jgi:hypothetical protein
MSRVQEMGQVTLENSKWAKCPKDTRWTQSIPEGQQVDKTISKGRWVM